MKIQYKRKTPVLSGIVLHTEGSVVGYGQAAVSWFWQIDRPDLERTLECLALQVEELALTASLQFVDLGSDPHHLIAPYSLQSTVSEHLVEIKYD